jgi:hypothetical protein
MFGYDKLTGKGLGMNSLVTVLQPSDNAARADAQPAKA